MFYTSLSTVMSGLYKSQAFYAPNIKSHVKWTVELVVCTQQSGVEDWQWGAYALIVTYRRRLGSI